MGNEVNVSSGIIIPVNGGTDVPYPIHSQEYISTSADTGSSDFVIDVTGATVVCKNCN